MTALPMTATRLVEMTTYRRADDELVYGEFSFVLDIDYLDEGDHDDPTEYVKETWVCTTRESLWYGPSVVCAECGEQHDSVPSGESCCDDAVPVEA